MPRRLFLGLLLLTACEEAAAPRPKAAPVVEAAKAVEALPTTLAPPIDAVVLLDDDRSVLLYADGTVRDTVPEMKVVTNGRLLTLDQPHFQKKYACASTGMMGTPTVDDYDSLSLSLVDADAKEKVLVPPLAYGPGGYTFDKLKTTVTAVLGTHVFVEVWHDTWNCGAVHPDFGNQGHHFDTATGKEVPFEPPPEIVGLAAQSLIRQGIDFDVHFEQAVIHFDAAGHASLAWQFWKEATYTDGIPRTTVDARAFSPTLPAPLTKLENPPSSVAAFLKDHPQKIKGWSR